MGYSLMNNTKYLSLIVVKSLNYFVIKKFLTQIKTFMKNIRNKFINISYMMFSIPNHGKNILFEFLLTFTNYNIYKLLVTDLKFDLKSII